MCFFSDAYEHFSYSFILPGARIIFKKAQREELKRLTHKID